VLETERPVTGVAADGSVSDAFNNSVPAPVMVAVTAVLPVIAPAVCARVTLIAATGVAEAVREAVTDASVVLDQVAAAFMTAVELEALIPPATAAVPTVIVTVLLAVEA
jgi:hypothetical protein